MSLSQSELLDRIHVALVETSLPANIGSTARAMKTMGLSRLVLVSPQVFPHAQATALAAGADDVLDAAKIATSVAEGLGGCGFVLGCSARARSVGLPTLDPRSAAQQLFEAAQRGPVAVMFGSERVGLSNADLSRCDAAVHIPSDPAFSSLNVAQAVQVLCYEIRMAALGVAGVVPVAATQSPGNVTEPGDVPATLAEMEGYFGHLEQTLGDIDFLKGKSARIIMQRLRRLFLRAAPSQREVQILRGILSDAQRQSRLAGANFHEAARGPVAADGKPEGAC